MDDASLLRINGRLAIPRNELEVKATRAGGPGGQHVNTAATRIELWWDLAGSPSLTDAQRERLLTRLAGRLDGRGRLRVVSAARRSQLQNREAALERFQALLADALAVRKIRRPTSPTRAAREERLRQKRLRASRKRERRTRGEE